MTAESDESFPWLDARLERIRTVPARDDDKTEWIRAYLELRLWMRYLSLYSDLLKHGGVEFDPETDLATTVRWKPEDIVEAIRYGDEGQLRAAVVQICGVEAVAPFIKLKRGRGGGKHHRDRKMDYAEEDYYYIRDLLYDTYFGADEKRLYRWYEDAIGLIADFHGVNPSGLDNRIKR